MLQFDLEIDLEVMQVSDAVIFEISSFHFLMGQSPKISQNFSIPML